MRLPMIVAVTLAMAAPVSAQDMSGLLSKLGGAQGSGGASSLLGSAGANNITGLLGYCLKNQLLGSAGSTASSSGGAAGLLGKLTGKTGVKQSQGFLAGQQGVVQAGGAGLPLGSLGDTVKQQVCKSVLSRASGLLAR